MRSPQRSNVVPRPVLNGFLAEWQGLHFRRTRRSGLLSAADHYFFAQDPERLARFEREAKVLAALNHPQGRQAGSVSAHDVRRIRTCLLPRWTMDRRGGMRRVHLRGLPIWRKNSMNSAFKAIGLFASTASIRYTFSASAISTGATMSFFRHEEILRQGGKGRPESVSRTIVSMSLRLAIPRRVGLHQNRYLLGRGRFAARKAQQAKPGWQPG
jgi:hypothetical protein